MSRLTLDIYSCSLSSRSGGFLNSKHFFHCPSRVLFQNAETYVKTPSPEKLQAPISGAERERR